LGLAIGQRQADLGHADGLVGVGAVEDAVFHLRAAQRLGALFAQHPAHRVGDVALAAPIGADDGRQARLELQARPIGEALETD